MGDIMCVSISLYWWLISFLETSRLPWDYQVPLSHHNSSWHTDLALADGPVWHCSSESSHHTVLCALLNVQSWNFKNTGTANPDPIPIPKTFKWVLSSPRSEKSMIFCLVGCIEQCLATKRQNQIYTQTLSSCVILKKLFNLIPQFATCSLWIIRVTWISEWGKGMNSY